jgi:release factor glutamine methyltransferase
LNLINFVSNSLRDTFLDYNHQAEQILLYILETNIYNIYQLNLEDISKNVYDKIIKTIELRKKRYPLQYILEKAYFFGRIFKVDKRVLIPRFETEILVEKAIELLKNKRDPKVLDLCTGSGAIAITLALELGIDIVASDISKDAIEIAKYNLNNLLNNSRKVDFILSDLFSNISGSFDLIVSNPPYISENEYKNLEPEVKFEPSIALLAGDGLNIYRSIISKVGSFLKKDGIIIFEIGSNQYSNISKLMEKKFKNIRVYKDYSYLDRLVLASKI